MIVCDIRPDIYSFIYLLIYLFIYLFWLYLEFDYTGCVLQCTSHHGVWESFSEKHVIKVFAIAKNTAKLVGICYKCALDRRTHVGLSGW